MPNNRARPSSLALLAFQLRDARSDLGESADGAGTQVIAKFGFVKRDTVEINLSKVEAVRVEQTFWGRMLNFGTILMSGTGGSIEPIPNIADPLVFRRKFREATDRPRTMPRQ